MTLSQLLAAFRIESGDLSIPQLWPDADVVGYLNEAEQEAAIRSWLLFDDSTAEICDFDTVVDQSAYALHEKVVEIRNAIISSTDYSRALKRTSRELLDDQDDEWETWPASTPEQYIQDETGIVLAAKPDDVYSINMAVFRLPLRDMALSADVTFQDTGDTVTQTAHGRIGGDRVSFSVITSTTGIAIDTEYFIRDVTTDTYKLCAVEGGDAIALTTNGIGTATFGGNSPEIHSRHHRNLIDWALYRAYSKRDADGMNESKAAFHLALFERNFGLRPDANVARKRRRPARQVKAIGF